MSARGGFTWWIYRRCWLPLFVKLMAFLYIPTPTGSLLLTGAVAVSWLCSLFLQLHCQKYIFLSRASYLMFLLPLSSTRNYQKHWTHTVLLPQTSLKTPNMDSSAAENSPEQMYCFCLFDLEWAASSRQNEISDCGVFLKIFKGGTLWPQTGRQVPPAVPHSSTRCPQSFLNFTCCCSSLPTCPWLTD